MPIKVKCPKPECGKVLEMADQFAGKPGMCPVCGSKFMVPKPRPPAPAPPPPPNVAVGRVVEDRSAPSASGPSAGYGQRADEDYDEYGRRSARRRKPRGGLDATSLIIAGVGLVLLILLAMTPFMPWIHVSQEAFNRSMSTSITGWKHPWADGQIIFGVSLGMTVLAGVCMMLVSMANLPREASDAFFGSGMAGVAAWGGITALWFIGWIWKTLTLSAEIPDNANAGVYPHVGLFLGLFAAAAVAVLFSVAAARRLRPEFLLIAHGIGLVVAILILVLHLEPWTTGRITGPTRNLPIRGPFGLGTIEQHRIFAHPLEA